MSLPSQPRYNLTIATQPQIIDKDREEFGIFVERFMHFMNIWTVYFDLLSGHYVPTVNPPSEEWAGSGDMCATMMFFLYAFFYSLIEDSPGGLNGFRVWRKRFHEEEAAIAAVEKQAAPFIKDLRVFRNRLAFHGSRSRAHEAAGFDLFVNHSGDSILRSMKNFKSLGAALLAKENAQQRLPGPDADRVRHWIDSIAARAQQERQNSPQP